MCTGTRLKGSTGGSNLDRDKAPRPAAEYKQLRTLLLALEDRIAAAVGKGETESVQPGEALFDLLASLKITERTAEMIRGEFILIRVWAIGLTSCFVHYRKIREEPLGLSTPRSTLTAYRGSTEAARRVTSPPRRYSPSPKVTSWRCTTYVWRRRAGARDE